MFDNLWDLLETCQDLLTVCQKLIITERERTAEQNRELQDEISKLRANETLKEILK